MKKILYLDIEVSPTKGYAYDKWEADILGVVERSIMFSIAWKWEHEKTIYCVSLADFPGFKKNPHNDFGVVKKSWELLNEADIVIAHNGANFDIKKLNAFFILHKLTPPSQFQVVDTLRVARRYFKFFGNSLDDLADVLGVGRKMETKKGLWRDCLDSTDGKPYIEMKRYNKHDVYLLVEVYKRLLPWIQNHPHVDPEMAEYACTNCGSKRMGNRGRERLVGGYKVKLHCLDCGHWRRGKFQKDE